MRVTFKTYDELMPLKDMSKSKHQRNKHPQDQIERLAKIMEKHGVRHPIHISRQSGQICFGHGRREAAILNGYKSYPIVYQEFKNDEEEYACVQSDNAIASWAELDLVGINSDIINLGPDFDIDLLGIKDFVLEPAEKFAGKTDDDEVPEFVEPRTKLGDIYTLGQHRLMCGDSTSVEAIGVLTAPIIVDLVYTDPPYGVGAVKSGKVGANFGVAQKGKYKAIAGDETTECAGRAYAACVAAGFKNFIIWGGNYFTDFLEPRNSWVVWNKRGDTSIRNTFADGELAWSNLGFPVRIHSQLWNGMIRSGEKDKRVHPTQKPVQLAEFCLDLAKDCKTIFDGFGGSGSTLIACEKTNRKCFMMELDPHYCDVIVTRWENYTGKKAELLNGKTKTTIRRSTNRKTGSDSLPVS